MAKFGTWDSQSSGKFPSSLRKFLKFQCGEKFPKIKKYTPLRFPKRIWEVPKFLFLEHFPKEFPKFPDIWEVPNFLKGKFTDSNVEANFLYVYVQSS